MIAQYFHIGWNSWAKKYMLALGNHLHCTYNELNFIEIELESWEIGQLLGGN